MSFDADMRVSTYSDPVGTPKTLSIDPVILAIGKLLPDGVNPKKAKYKSSVLKLFAYNFKPKSLTASATISLDIP